MQLALELFDLEAVPLPSSSRDITDDEHTLEHTDGERTESAPTPRKRLAWIAPTARRAARHPIATATGGFATVRSIARTVAPVNETSSPIMKGRSTSRSLGLIEVELADLKRAAKVAGGSVNDAFMAAVAGGLRRYHESQGAPVEELRVTFPISIRTPDDPPGGNRITLIRFAVPVSETDPASRIRAIEDSCRAARDERSLRFTGAIAASLNVLPRRVVGNMLKHVDFLASDIPGFAFPVYLAGAHMEGYVVFAPTIGTAVNFALLSYCGSCSVGVSMDPSAIADTARLLACVRDGFEEVLALGGPHDPVRMPLARDRRSAVQVASSM
jgi:diacylglycerol O-acyltransferase